MLGQVVLVSDEKLPNRSPARMRPSWGTWSAIVSPGDGSPSRRTRVVPARIVPHAASYRRDAWGAGPTTLPAFLARGTALEGPGSQHRDLRRALSVPMGTVLLRGEVRAVCRAG